MDLRHARTFVTVADLGTVSKAAARLHIAQPALSRQIRDLEQELGLKLFDRVGRRLVLTGEGEQLLGDCRSLLNCASSIGERAQQLRRGDGGILKVAASPQFIEGTLSGFLDRFTQRYPNVQVKVIEAIAWSDTLGMLERGEIHLGQNLLRVVQPDDPHFASHPLEAVDLLAASHAPLMLGKSGAIEIAHLASQPLLVLDTSFLSRRTFDATCRLAGIEANIVFESRTPHTLLAMAESGHGVAIVPSAVRIDLGTLSIGVLPGIGKEAIILSIVMAVITYLR
jgi:DNA-binding transcriptional LysR family regulator